MDAAVSRADAAEKALRVARFVAEHWRDALMESEATQGWSHPLAMVLTAMDGETDPVKLGIDGHAHAALAAALLAEGER